MMPRRTAAGPGTEVGIADLVRGLGKLKPQDGEHAAMVARCLGFELESEQPLPRKTPYRSQRGAWDPHRFPRNAPRTRKPPAFTPPIAMPPAPDPAPELPEEMLSIELDPVEDHAPMLAGGAPPAEILAAEPLGTDSGAGLPRSRLFPRQTARGVLTEALAQQVPGSEPDIARLIDAAVRREPLVSMSTRSRTTTRNGCQLLLDFNEALTPWWPDLQNLIDQFQSMFGRDSCPAYEFDGDALSAFRWNEGQGKIDWQPLSGVPVVVATDLGVTRYPPGNIRPPASAWVALARRCQRHEAPLIAIEPVDHTRWPRGLDRWMRIIHWNPATTAAAVKRLLTEQATAR